MSDFLYPDAEDVEFERSSLDTFYIKHQLNPERIDQIHREILFSDLVADLTGKSGSMIRCPFHGTDSTPSFEIYPPARGNNGWCYGCPQGRQYWDHIRFVREILGLNFRKAVEWLEKTYSLPYIEDVIEEPEEEEEETIITVGFEDLREPYIIKARREIHANRDFEQAGEFLRIYYDAEHLNAQADALLKSREIEDAEERHKEFNRLKTKAAIKLARVLGRKLVEEVARTK